MFSIFKDEKETVTVDVAAGEENSNISPETSDEELKVLELQRAKRVKKKIAAKNNSNIAVQLQTIEIGNKNLL